MITKHFIMLVAICLIQSTSSAQTSVYNDNNNVLYVTNWWLNSPAPTEGNKIEIGTSSETAFTTDINKDVIGCSQIRLVPKTRLVAPTSSSNELHLSITPEHLDIISYTHSNLSEIRALEKFETGVELPQEIEDRIAAFKLNDQDTLALNPFMEWDIALKVNYTNVYTGDTFFNYGFYFEDYTRFTPGFPNFNHGNWGWKKTLNSEEFRVRYAFPEQEGVWKVEYELYVENELYHSYCPFNVTVIEKNADDGFVKVAANKRVLERNNELFLPIGQNLTWPDQYKINDTTRVDCEYDFTGKPCESAAFFDFDKRMQDYADAGMDYYRLILSPGSIDIEFEKMGNYFDRLNYAKEIDKIIEFAEENDIYIDFNMKVHFNLIDGPVYALFAWDGSDYTAPGFNEDYGKQQLCYVEELDMESPAEFLTNPIAKKYYKQKMRYLYSRWGYSTNIAMFELISEINQVGDIVEVSYNFPPDTIISDTSTWYKYSTTYSVPDPAGYGTNVHRRNDIYQWHKEMAEYIKDSLEHTQHLLTCSYAGIPQYLQSDFASGYGDLSFALPEFDLISYNDYSFDNLNFMKFFSEKVKYCHDVFDKPVILSEMGTLLEYCSDTKKDYTKQLWQNMFIGACGFSFWTYRTGEYADDWQEMKRLKSWILDDPEKTEILLGDWKTGHAHGTERGSSWFNTYWRKEMNYIYVTNPPGSTHKYKGFGAMINLTDNYYTNLNLTNSRCDNYNNESPWLEERLVYETNIQNQVAPIDRLLVKNDLSGADDVIWSPWGFQDYFSETSWYDFETFNNIPGLNSSFSVPSLGLLAPFLHQTLYVTESNVATYGNRAIMPFQCMFSPNSYSGMMTSENDFANEERWAVQETDNSLEILKRDSETKMEEALNEVTSSTTYSIYITNLMGQTIYTGKLELSNQQGILTSSFPTGMLIITLVNNNEKHTLRWLNL